MMKLLKKEKPSSGNPKPTRLDLLLDEAERLIILKKGEAEVITFSESSSSEVYLLEAGLHLFIQDTNSPIMNVVCEEQYLEQRY